MSFAQGEATPDFPSLSRWLLGEASPPSVGGLRSAGLAAYAYTALPREHSLRDALRADYASALARHHRIKAEVQPLLRAWRSAGIDVLIFKGFQLAEFVYDAPGTRFHADVDLVVAPHDVHRAVQAAEDSGWHAAFRVAWRLRPSHDVAGLRRPGGAARVDVHDCALHVMLPWRRAQRRITEALWASSTIRWWDDVNLREPAPVDMLLVGLILQRAWGSEHWQPKPLDAADFRAITKRYGVTRDALRARARELRCERTLAAFLERCDPEAGRLDLAPVPPAMRRRLNRRVFVERGPLGATERFLARAGGAAFLLSLGARFVPLVLRVRSVLRRHADLRTLMAAVAVDADAHARGSRRLPRHYIVTGVDWAVRLVGTGRFGGCLVRALAAYAAFRQQGDRVDFVSGVRRDGPRIVGHAWLEREGSPLMEAERDDAPAPFEESFRFPGVARASTASGVRGPASNAAIQASPSAPARAPQTPRN